MPLGLCGSKLLSPPGRWTSSSATTSPFHPIFKPSELTCRSAQNNSGGGGGSCGGGPPLSKFHPANYSLTIRNTLFNRLRCSAQSNAHQVASPSQCSTDNSCWGRTVTGSSKIAGRARNSRPVSPTSPFSPSMPRMVLMQCDVSSSMHEGRFADGSNNSSVTGPNGPNDTGDSGFSDPQGTNWGHTITAFGDTPLDPRLMANETELQIILGELERAGLACTLTGSLAHGRGGMLDTGEGQLHGDTHSMGTIGDTTSHDGELGMVSAGHTEPHGDTDSMGSDGHTAPNGEAHSMSSDGNTASNGEALTLGSVDHIISHEESHSMGSTDDIYVVEVVEPVVRTVGALDRKLNQSSSSSPTDSLDSLATDVTDLVKSGKDTRPISECKDDAVALVYAIATGALVAAIVFCFDVSIQFIHDLPDLLASMAATQCWSGGWEDEHHGREDSQVFRKAAASAITLGSGASLGPEAPSVEIGANTAALLLPKGLLKRHKTMLIAAGAAAGVSAAFDAPVAGALFAVEFVLKANRLGLDRLSTSTVFVSTSVAAGVVGFLRAEGQALGITGAPATWSAASLISVECGEWKVVMGARCPRWNRLPSRSPRYGWFAFIFPQVCVWGGKGGWISVLYEGVHVSEVVMRPLPRWISDPLAGAACGLVAFKFPQVQYGYVNLEDVFGGSIGQSTSSLFSLLAAKIVATSVCVGGGLVGGLFAPSLFLGAVVGDIMAHTLSTSAWGVAETTSLIVVGAAAVLGAACRAPLTAMALMVEITRGTSLLVPMLAPGHQPTGPHAGPRAPAYWSPCWPPDTGLLVPLLAAIGTASLLTDYLEGIFSDRFELKAQMSVGLLGCNQARSAMIEKGTTAAIVVDDNFSPMGVVELSVLEDELIKEQMLHDMRPDANFEDYKL
eukprot:gene28218-31321_t